MFANRMYRRTQEPPSACPDHELLGGPHHPGQWGHTVRNASSPDPSPEETRKDSRNRDAAGHLHDFPSARPLATAPNSDGFTARLQSRQPLGYRKTPRVQRKQT